MIDTLVSFWESISSFFDNIWDLIVNFFNTATRIYELAVNSLYIPQFIGQSSFIPPTLKAVFIFVCSVALIKLVISLGSYSE